MFDLGDWEVSDVSAVGGWARFDGLTIETDSIDYPGSDRVMPIVDEEQVLMCRMMLPSVPQGSYVLDIGTGSGVLGLACAKHNRCRVVGIDVSARAIEFAGRNALNNGITVIREGQPVPEGGIQLIQISARSYACLADVQGQFDVVLLNPPFNPTCPGLEVATHAASGEDGQRCFRDHLEAALALRSDAGMVIGYQMSYDRKPAAVAAVDEIAGRWPCRVEYLNCLQDAPSYPVAEFLRQQYSSLLRPSSSGKGLGLNEDVVEDYIVRLGGSGQVFSLIYYEARGLTGSAQPGRHVQLVRGLPQRTWADRIWLHRRIVQTATE